MFSHSSRSQKSEARSLSVSVGLHSLQRLERRIHYLPLPAAGGFWHLRLGATFLCSLFTLPPPPVCLLSFLKTLTIGLRAHLAIQDDLLISRSLIISAKAPYPNKISFTGPRNLDVDISLGEGATFKLLQLLTERLVIWINTEWRMYSMPKAFSQE